MYSNIGLFFPWKFFNLVGTNFLREEKAPLSFNKKLAIAFVSASSVLSFSPSPASFLALGVDFCGNTKRLIPLLSALSFNVFKSSKLKGWARVNLCDYLKCANSTTKQSPSDISGILRFIRL